MRVSHILSSCCARHCVFSRRDAHISLVCMLCMTCLLPGYLAGWVVSSPCSVSPVTSPPDWKKKMAVLLYSNVALKCRKFCMKITLLVFQDAEGLRGVRAQCPARYTSSSLISISDTLQWTLMQQAAVPGIARAQQTAQQAPDQKIKKEIERTQKCQVQSKVWSEYEYDNISSSLACLPCTDLVPCAVLCCGAICSLIVGL
jgi:hypothetical protein